MVKNNSTWPNCPSFLTATQLLARWTHRSGPATGNHQDPATAVLLPRRTAHPLGAPPHFASSRLALGSRVQWRPGTIARPATPNLTAPVPLTRSGQLNIVANSRQLGPPGTLPGLRIPPAMARPPASCRCGCPHAALIPIYWNLARPVRLPLPIIPLCQRHGRLASVDSGLGVIIGIEIGRISK